MRVVYCDLQNDSHTVDAIQAFRKRKFVDELGWPLQFENERERDTFDGPDAVYCGLFENEEIVGCFRAIPTDRPYLAQTRFPQLADHISYPSTPHSFEISRLAVAGGTQAFSRSIEVYAAMLHFSQILQLTSLVAFCDVGHERLLKRIGIVTRRFGGVHDIGHDLHGRPIRAVAGEIVMREQDPTRLDVLLAPVRYMEIEDGISLFRRFSLSA